MFGRLIGAAELGVRLKMRFAIPVALITLVGGVFAAPNEIRSDSPSRAFSAIFKQNSNTEDYQLTLVASDGKIQYHSAPINLEISEKSIIWKSSGDAICFSAGTHFLMEAYVLIARDGGYSLKKLPGPEHGWDNFHQIPQKWSGDLLTLTVDGPYGGKADGYRYEGFMTVKLSDQLTTVSEDINTVEQDAAANP